MTVYVSTDRVFSEPVLREYEKQSGVTVNAVYDTEETKSTGLANRLLAEKARPQADVFWSNEPVRTLVLKPRDVLASYRSPSAKGIPDALIDPEGYWTGFSARIRVIAYNTKALKSDDAPKSIFDLADPKWKGHVAMADPVLPVAYSLATTLGAARSGYAVVALDSRQLAVSEFGVPGLLRVRVYTIEVFTEFAALYDFARALALALPLLILCEAVAVAAAALLGDRLVTTRRSLAVSPVVFQAWRRLALAGLALVVATALALPLSIPVREALGARSLATATGSINAIVNSLLLAGVGATLIVNVAVCLGYAQARASRGVRLAAQVVLVALFAVPSTIIGVGLIGLWNRAGAGATSGPTIDSGLSNRCIPTLAAQGIPVRWTPTWRPCS